MTSRREFVKIGLIAPVMVLVPREPIPWWHPPTESPLLKSRRYGESEIVLRFYQNDDKVYSSTHQVPTIVVDDKDVILLPAPAEIDIHPDRTMYYNRIVVYLPDVDLEVDLWKGFGYAGEKDTITLRASEPGLMMVSNA